LSAHCQQHHEGGTAPVNWQPPRHKRQICEIGEMPNSHVAENTEEYVFKMYKCRFCEQMFRSQDGRKNHENVKHSRNKCYKCSFCSQVFLTRQAAYTHRVKYHRVLITKTQ